jgi:HlyD family secretion protein
MQPKRKSRRILWIVSIVFVVAVVVLTGSWLRRRLVRADTDPGVGQVVTAFIGQLSTAASASGRLLPQREAQLSVAIPGRVEQVFVEVGDQVPAGDVLLQLENGALQWGVRKAEQNLAVQEANLSELRNGATEEEVAAAEAAVLSAKAQLDDLLAGPGVEELADAEAALASARAHLEDLLAGPSVEALTQAKAALASAQAAEAAAAARYAAIDDQIVVARQQLAYAEVTLRNARYFYDALANDWQHKDYAPFSPEAEALKDAQTAYDVALARYNLVVADVNDSAYRSAQAQVAQAKANLAALTEEKTVEIASAREQVAAAEARLAALTGDKSAQIASARDQLAQAEVNLANLLEGASEERLAIAEAQVEQARISLADAQARLADAMLFAPFDGMVTAVSVSVGEWASGQAAELADTSSLEVVLDVDEIDIGSIAVGQSTVITLEAWPDRELKGKVVAIAPKAQANSEIVTYQVHIGADWKNSPDGEDLPIRIGMTANADLITSEQDNVLLVSNRAVTADREAGKYYVYRKEGDAVSKVEVTVGSNDGSYTEIVGGLEEGDELVIDYVEEGLPFGPGQGRPMGR